MKKINKDPQLIVHTTDPVNAEPPLDKLQENFITPQPLYYIRNHGDVPEIDPDKFRLIVNGMVEYTLELSLDNLKKDFSRRTIMATLQCAGNRRNQMIDFAPVPNEVPWQEGAIGNATWTGAPLKEILEKIHGIKVVINKKRKIYFIENVKFHFDQVESLGNFIEVEAIDNDGSIGTEKLEKQCNYFISFLGIKKEDFIAESYSDLLLNKNTKV